MPLELVEANSLGSVKLSRTELINAKPKDNQVSHSINDYFYSLYMKPVLLPTM